MLAVGSFLSCVVAQDDAPALRGSIEASANTSVSIVTELSSSARTEEKDPKVLDEPSQYLGQLKWNADPDPSRSQCQGEQYRINANMYGVMISQDGDQTPSHYYPTDKAVSWASGPAALGTFLGDCCGKTDDQCVCDIANIAGLLDDKKVLYPGKATYSYVAFLGNTADGTEVVSPTWENLGDVMPKTFDWVFNDLTLTEQATQRLHSSDCGLSKTMQTLAEISSRYTLGTDEAYKFIFDTYMSPACDEISCKCKGYPTAGEDCDSLCSNGYCGDESAELFCGEGGRDACDPAQFLCAQSDGQEVGYVRAYLHMFLDCNPQFQGNGCSSGSKDDGNCNEEFVVIPNQEITEQTAVLQLAKVENPQCTPDN